MAAPETIIDPDAVIRVGRAAVDHAVEVCGVADGVELGPTGVADAAARATLVERVRAVGARLEHNGTALEQLGREYRELDGAVALSFRLRLDEGWR